MFDRPRIIPTILLDDQRMVKTMKFSHPNYLGDPINAVKIYNEKQVDELCILDITRNKSGINFDLLQDIASEAFMPLSYGGGINDMDQVKKLFHIGFEKVIINSSLYSTPKFVEMVVEYAGSQSVVASIDYKKSLFNKVNCYSHCGKKKNELTPLDMAVKVEKMGVGEILLYSIDRDGMMGGYDLSVVSEVSSKISIPLIACGGAGCLDDIKNVITAGADAAAAGSIFVYYGEKKGVLISYPTESEMAEAGIFM